MMNSHDLGARRARWTEWLKGLLRNTPQKDIAIDIQVRERDGRSKSSAVNRFIHGDPVEIRKWFDEKPEWLSILLRGTGVTAEQARDRFWSLMRGEESSTPWHPAFPELTLDQVEIPAPLEAIGGKNATQIASREVARLGKPEGWNASTPPDPLLMVAPPGSRREIAARQVKEALDAELLRVAGGSAVPFTVEMRSSPQKEEEPGRWILVVQERDDDMPDLRKTLRLSPWGGAEVSALARRIAVTPGVSPDQRRKLEGFASKLDADPSLVDSTLSVDLLIHLLAEVSRHGSPQDHAGTRRLLTRAAWEKACGQGERLPAFEENLMEVLCANLATRSRAPDEAGGWTRASRRALERTLARSLVDMGASATGRTLLDLVEEAGSARGVKRQKVALSALRTAIASDSVAAVIDELLQGHILSVESPPGDRRLRVAEPVLASAWAARGLGSMPQMAGRWERLLDPDWGTLVEEFAHAGREFGALADMLADAPEELCLDKALWLIRHASAAPAVSRDPRLVEAWATVLWAASHWLFASTPLAGCRWRTGAEPILRSFSWRYRHLLPGFGDDAVAMLERTVPEYAKRIVRRWRATPFAKGGRAKIRHGEHPFQIFSELPGRDDLERTIRHLSPAQCLPDTPARWAWWRDRDAEMGLMLVEELANAGHSGCRAMLSGRAWCEEARRNRGVENPEDWHAADFWRKCPPPTRMRWALADGLEGDDLLQVFLELARCSVPMDDLLRLAAGIPLTVLEEQVHVAVQRFLRGFPPLLGEDVLFAVAESRKLADVLEELADIPKKGIAEARIHFHEVGLFLRVPGGAVSIRPVVPKDPHLEAQVTLPVTEWLERWETLAHRAAVSLHRLGKPHALRTRWREGCAQAPETLLRDERRHVALLRMFLTPPGLWQSLVFREPETKVPSLQTLASHAHGDGDWSQVSDRSDLFIAHSIGLPQPRALGMIREVGTASVDPLVLRALEGVWRLFQDLPEELPTELSAFLDAAGRVEQPYYLGGPAFSPRQVAWSERSAMALLDEGDLEPLHTWYTTNARSPNAALAEYSARGVVERRLKEDDRFLEMVWEHLPAEPPDMHGRAHDLRRRLLLEGSLPWTTENVAGARTRPCAFVVEEAIRTRDPDLLDLLTRLNGRSSDWSVVARHHRRRARDYRSRAWWALQIQGGSGEEARESLREWLQEDPDPISGGRTWAREGDRYVGGVEELLTAALVLEEPWVKTGFARLWQAALRLPICEPGSRLLDTSPPAMCVLHPSIDTPWPLDVIADALVSRGMEKAVLDAWRSPPDEPPPVEDALGWTRGTWIRTWLNRWWIRLAPSTEIKEALLAGEPLNLEALQELLRCGGEDLLSAAERATLLVEPWYFPLAVVAPDRLVPAFERRRSISGAWPQMDIAAFIHGASEPGWEVPEALWEARRTLACLPEQVEASPSASIPEAKSPA